MANSKRQLFIKRRLRVRNKLRKVNAGRVRLSVHRSNKNISVQLIDDVQGKTLASASSLEKDLGIVGKNNVEAATKVGESFNRPSGREVISCERTFLRAERGWLRMSSPPNSMAS